MTFLSLSFYWITPYIHGIGPGPAKGGPQGRAGRPQGVRGDRPQGVHGDRPQGRAGRPQGVHGDRPQGRAVRMQGVGRYRVGSAARSVAGGPQGCGGRPKGVRRAVLVRAGRPQGENMNKIYFTCIYFFIIIL